MKTAALYARVSTLDQNCDLQLEGLRRYARQRFECLREYVDRGISGTQRHRPQLDVLVKDARKRMFDVVLVWKFDRFARSLKHLIDSLEEFRALGIDFISYTEGIDTTTPTGQLLFHMVGAVAQFERDLIIERVRAGMSVFSISGAQVPTTVASGVLHSTRTTSSNSTVSPTARLVAVQLMGPELPGAGVLQLQPAGAVTETRLVPAGTASVSVRLPASAGPLFSSVMV